MGIRPKRPYRHLHPKVMFQMVTETDRKSLIHKQQLYQNIYRLSIIITKICYAGIVTVLSPFMTPHSIILRGLYNTLWGH